MMLVLHVCPLHPDAPATSEGVDRRLYLLPDLPPVQQDVAECLLGQNVSDCSLDQTLQHCGQTGYSWAAQCHVLYLVITHRAQLRPHQVLCHHLRTNIWEHTSRFQTGIFKYVMQCVSISVPREEEPSTSSVGCQLCDTRQEVGGGKKGLKRKKDRGDIGCHSSEASHELRFIIRYRPSHRLLSGSTHF